MEYSSSVINYSRIHLMRCDHIVSFYTVKEFQATMNAIWHSKVNPKTLKTSTPSITSAISIFNIFSVLFMGSIQAWNITCMKSKKRVIFLYSIRVAVILGASLYMLHVYINSGGVKLRITQVIFNVFTLCVIFAYSILTFNQMSYIFNEFEKGCKLLNRYKITFGFSKIRIICFMEMFVIVFFSSCTFIWICYEYDSKYCLVLFILHIIPNGIIMIYLCHYINLLLVLRGWLSDLNKSVHQTSLNNYEFENGIITVRIVYGTIWRLSKLIEDYFALPALCINATSFLNTTAYIYLWLMSNHVHPSTYFWVLANLLKLFVLPFVCNLCISQEEKIRKNLKYLLSLSLYTSNQSEIVKNECMLLFAQQNISFSVCGFFQLNLQHIFSAMAAVTIYVVIFKQNNVRSE